MINPEKWRRLPFALLWRRATHKVTVIFTLFSWAALQVCSGNADDGGRGGSSHQLVSNKKLCGYRTAMIASPQWNTWPCVVTAGWWLWHRCLGLEALVSGPEVSRVGMCCLVVLETLFGGGRVHCFRLQGRKAHVEVNAASGPYINPPHVFLLE